MELEAAALPVAGSLIECCSCGCSCSNVYLSSGGWNRTMKRKYDELGGTTRSLVHGMELDSAYVVRVQAENEIDVLREMVTNNQLVIQDLTIELEEERNASSSAANEAMSMILRLQKEKSEIQMEAKQFKRFAEEKMIHDQQEFSVMEDLLYKREQTIQSLRCEVQAYKHRMMSYGLTEAEAEGEKNLGLSRSQSMVEVVDEQFESPRYNYPPLKCSINETPRIFEVEPESPDVEKYAFDDTPHSSRGQELKNLEQRLNQIETIPSNNNFDGDINGGNKNILEKVVVGHSPSRQTRISRKFSLDSSSPFMGGMSGEMGPEWPKDSPRPTINIKRMNHFSENEEDPDSPILKNASEFEDEGVERVCTIDSIHNGMVELKGVKVCEDFLSTPRDHVESDDPDIQKLYMRLQALEADRESMRQAIISMRTDNAQLILLREIAQRLCNDKAPDNKIPPKKPPVSRPISSSPSVLKMVASCILWRNRARKTKHFFGLSENNAGLLMVLDKNPFKKPLCVTKTDN